MHLKDSWYDLEIGWKKKHRAEDGEMHVEIRHASSTWVRKGGWKLYNIQGLQPLPSEKSSSASLPFNNGEVKYLTVLLLLNLRRNTEQLVSIDLYTIDTKGLFRPDMALLTTKRVSSSRVRALVPVTGEKYSCDFHMCLIPITSVVDLGHSLQTVNTKIFILYRMDLDHCLQTANTRILILYRAEMCFIDYEGLSSHSVVPYLRRVTWFANRRI